MATDLSASFNEQYININTKLKKRFMRKPNITEAANEFLALAIQCEHSEQPAFAGQTYVGAAKCEASIGNPLGEAEHYISAARQFMKAEKKLAALKFHSPDRENLEAAIGCYTQALKKYPEKSTIHTSILLELAEELMQLDLKLEALVYYEQALETATDGVVNLMCSQKILNALIECKKYEYALEMANKICESNLHMPESVLTEIQVSRVLLALLVDSGEETRDDSLKQLFDELLNDEDNNALPFNMDLKLKLQSIIISSSMDHQALVVIAASTKPHLTIQQRELLETLMLEKQTE